MVTSRRSFALLAVLLCLVSVSAVAAEKKDFDARWRDAEQNVRAGAGQQYFNDVFFKEFFGKYAVHMTECAQRTGERMTADLTMAVEVGARGQVLMATQRGQHQVHAFYDVLRRTLSAPDTPNAAEPAHGGVPYQWDEDESGRDQSAMRMPDR